MSTALALIPLAHLGHWWTYILYAVPVLIVLASVANTMLKERREGRAESESGAAADERTSPERPARPPKG